MMKRSPYRLRIVPTPTGQWFGHLMVNGTEIGRISPCATPEDVCIAAIRTMQASPDYITVRRGEKVIYLYAGRPHLSLLRVRAAPEDRFDTVHPHVEESGLESLR